MCLFTYTIPHLPPQVEAVRVFFTHSLTSHLKWRLYLCFLRFPSISTSSGGCASVFYTFPHLPPQVKAVCVFFTLPLNSHLRWRLTTQCVRSWCSKLPSWLRSLPPACSGEFLLLAQMRAAFLKFTCLSTFSHLYLKFASASSRQTC